MAKDPAFLFYPNHWLQGTSAMMPDEKGVYIDLLSHQHQDKTLPNDIKRLSRMCGLSIEEFTRIWEVVSKKFTTNSDNRLVNRKLTEVMTERSTKSSTNKITGQFAALLRTSNYTHDFRELLKKEFNIDHFMTKSDRSVKERLTEWMQVRSESITNTNSIIVYKEVKHGENGKSENGYSGNFKARGEEVMAKRMLEGIEAANKARSADSGSQE